MEHFSLKNIMTWIYRVIMLNGLFILFSLPIVTIGAASTATVATAHNLRVSNSDDVYKYFVGAFKSHFKTATKVWLGMLLFGGVLLYNLINFEPIGSIGSLIWLIQLPLVFQVVMIGLFVFSILSRFEVSSMRAVKCAWIISNRNLLLSIGVFGFIVLGFEIGRYVPVVNIFLLSGTVHILIDYVLDISMKRIKLDQNIQI